MIKLISEIEVQIEKWVAKLHLDPSTPIDVAEKMILQLLQILGKIKEQNAAAQAQPPAEPPKVEEIPQEPKPE